MSKRSKNTLLALGRSHQSALMEELLAMKYTMKGPAEGVYPYEDYDAEPAASDAPDDADRRHRPPPPAARRMSRSKRSPGFEEALPAESPHTPHGGAAGANGDPPAAAAPAAAALGPTYPDFSPWVDHTALSPRAYAAETEKITNNAYLNKGYFEPPLVLNEYYLARNMVQNKVFASPDTCQLVLADLLDLLAGAFRMRIEQVNKIGGDTAAFRVPPRATLTALKREQWFRELANALVPLLQFGGRVPHGVRNKGLVEQMCVRLVPIPRAVWFTKCVLTAELRRHPHGTPDAAAGDQWFQEWTQQLADYILKFAREMPLVRSAERKQTYTRKLVYLLAYTQHLYIECLVDKTTFLSLVVRFLTDGLPADPVEQPDVALNYGQRLVALAIVKTYWNDVLKLDYLCKELTEALLLNYHVVAHTSTRRAPAHASHTVGSALPALSPAMPSGAAGSPAYAMSPMAATPQGAQGGGLAAAAAAAPATAAVTAPFSVDLKRKILKSIAETTVFLVKLNANVFVIPNHWPVVGRVLQQILDAVPTSDSVERERLRRQFTLIQYRNESLMLNLGALVATSKLAARSRSASDVLGVVHQLDVLRLDEALAARLRPPGRGDSRGASWQQLLKVVLYWCTTPYRTATLCEENILVVCNFIKKFVLYHDGAAVAALVRVEFESEVLEILYDMAAQPLQAVSPHKLYVLVNELYQLKLVTISLYLRKLIASGIFYEGAALSGTDQRLIDAHVGILRNFPVLNNRQCDSIQRKWSASSYDFQAHFDGATAAVLRAVLPPVASELDAALAQIGALPVGLKFLLANWTTTRFRQQIASLPKLVHIDPDAVARLYRFYTVCDSLTVFLKVIVRLLLKNDEMVIVYYTDTLRLVSRLLLRHHDLVLVCSDAFWCSSGLFALVASSYRDLAQREPCCFDFKEVWRFMLKQCQDALGGGSEDEDERRGLQALRVMQVEMEDLLAEQRPALEESEATALAAAVGCDKDDLAGLLRVLARPAEDAASAARLLARLRDADPKQFAADVLNLSDTADVCSLVTYDLIDVAAVPAVLLNPIEAEEAFRANPCSRTLVWSIATNHYCATTPQAALEWAQQSPAWLEWLTIRAPHLVLAEFVDKAASAHVEAAFCAVLHVEELTFGAIARAANEYSLTWCQMVLRRMVTPENSARCLDEVMAALAFTFAPQNSYFGELFDFIDADSKRSILQCLEELFLTQTCFDARVSLTDAQGLNLLPVLKDFFTKFALEGDVATTPRLLEQLTEYTARLAAAVDAALDGDSDVYNAVCVCIRILIIHKRQLVPMFVQRNDGFALVRNLIGMLHSRWLASGNNEKVRILLHDLLLLMKGAISEAATAEAAAASNADGGGATAPASDSLQVFTLPEPTTDNPLAEYLRSVDTLATLDDRELAVDSDYYQVGRLMGGSHVTLSLKSYELLEETGDHLNGGVFNLLLFGAYTSRQNPP